MSEAIEWSLRSAVVGSPVRARKSRHERIAILTVTKANKTKVSLSDGSDWTRRGNRWGSSSWDTGSACLILDMAAVQAEVAEEEQERALESMRRTLGNRCDTEVPRLSAEECRAVSTLLDAAKESRGGKP